MKRMVKPATALAVAGFHQIQFRVHSYLFRHTL